MGHFFSGVYDTRSPEVYDSYFWIYTISVKQKIFWFEVSMDYVARVTIVDCRKNLFYDVSCVFFAEVLLLCDSFEELSAVAKPKIVD